MELSENIRQWFSDLIEEAIREARGTIENEHIWALGSETAEEATQHEQNCEENRAYIELLEKVKKDYLEN